MSVVSFFRSALAVALAVSFVPPAHAASDAPIKIAFVGDSMADGLWGAMFRRLGKDKCLAEKIKLFRKAKNGTGLTRLDQFNWIDEVSSMTDDPAPDVFFGSFGINDRQGVVDASKARVEYPGPAFDKKYQGNVQELILAATSKGAWILIAGLPIMRDEKPNTDALAKNKLFADAVAALAKPTASYVEPWTAKTPDEFKPYLPNAANTMVLVRAEDGIHFTGIGYDMVMDHFYTAVIDMIKRRGRDVAAECVK